MILYVETNLILAIAKGQDPEATELLQNPLCDSVRIVIPSICYMEALVAFEEDRQRRENFRKTMDQQLSEARRDATAPDRLALVSALSDALVRYSNLLNDVEARFQMAVQAMSSRFEMVHLTPESLVCGLNERFLSEQKQRRDNLVLQCILHHARQYPNDRKILLTNDAAFWKDEIFSQPTPAKQALLDAGVDQHFTRTKNFLGWLQQELKIQGGTPESFDR
ncbi:PIN domain-containing protein [Leptolyngbya boryana CZ1]|uniref:PIN domain-containing protein n=1 Tax=Leptolyngbya boryana CZ1 TaxID=3060204 RepID=A0AA96WXL6_LEPBY|nr:PIN domain-containing protein [Leptolyngbya boryana]WNZ46009.1 PIN domain-containing protein [Leptolyngbya boryana CZ1]